MLAEALEANPTAALESLRQQNSPEYYRGGQILERRILNVTNRSRTASHSEFRSHTQFHTVFLPLVRPTD